MQLKALAVGRASCHQQYSMYHSMLEPLSVLLAMCSPWILQQILAL